MNIWHICLHLMCVMSVVLGNGFDELLSLAKDMLFPKIPSYFDGPLAHVNFVSGGVAEANNELTPEDVKYAPTVKWDSIQHTHYTLCLIEPIPQFWKDLQIKGYLHWLVVNIPSSYVERGETLAPYEMGQSLEEQTGGNHSYALFVYRQPLVMNYHERRLDGKSPHGHRLNFDFTEFATEYLLYIPEYTNRFWIVYPESKDTLLARLKALELKLNKKV